VAVDCGYAILFGIDPLLAHKRRNISRVPDQVRGSLGYSVTWLEYRTGYQETNPHNPTIIATAVKFHSLTRPVKKLAGYPKPPASW
jgi:hypothetical protein